MSGGGHSRQSLEVVSAGEEWAGVIADFKSIRAPHRGWGTKRGRAVSAINQGAAERDLPSQRAPPPTEPRRFFVLSLFSRGGKETGSAVWKFGFGMRSEAGKGIYGAQFTAWGLYDFGCRDMRRPPLSKLDTPHWLSGISVFRRGSIGTDTEQRTCSMRVLGQLADTTIVTSDTLNPKPQSPNPVL